MISGGCAATGRRGPERAGVANAAAATPIPATDTNTASTTETRRTVK